MGEKRRRSSPQQPQQPGAAAAAAPLSELPQAEQASGPELLCWVKLDRQLPWWPAKLASPVVGGPTVTIEVYGGEKLKRREASVERCPVEERH